MNVLIRGFDHHVINENGSVINLKTNKILKPTIYKNGYYVYTIWENGKSYKRYLHRILCESFLPNPNNKKTINHIDGNKLNNSLNNLEWNTYQENIQHAYDHNLNYCSTKKFDKSNCKFIFKRFMNHENLTTIVKDYNISLSTLSPILKEFIINNKLEDIFNKEKYYQKVCRQSKPKLNDYSVKKYTIND